MKTLLNCNLPCSFKKLSELIRNILCCNQNSYDAMMLLATAINKVGEDPDLVKQALLSIQNYPGASGVLNFDENGDVKKDVLIKQIQDKDFVKIS